MTKTLFIGLDGATFTVLDDMTRERPDVGVTMPFLKQFFENGARAKLRSTPNPLTPPAWTSVMTGRSPGNHGVYDFIRAEEKGDDVYFTLYDARDIDAETIWSIATRQARSVVALNFPLTAPPRENEGMTVPGFVPWKHLRRNVSPPDLFERLQNIPKFNPKELAWDFEREKQAMEKLTDDETEDWVRYHLPREEQWFQIAEYLMREEQPDLMAVMFDGTDKIQHQAWQFLDPDLLKEAPTAWEQRMREVCLAYFRHLDRYIEKLVGLAGPDTQVFMASDHGFTATTEVFRINTFLHEKGYLTWKHYGDTEIDRRRQESNFAAVDWSKTVAYCRTPSSNGVYIRVASDPGRPGVKPEEYDGFRARIIEDLYGLRDEETGERIVREVLKREDVFPGPHMHEAPDLTLVLRDYGFVSIRDLAPAVVKRPVIAGTHHPDGVFLAGGMGIEAGNSVERRDIVDVAPTLLHSLGLEVPEDFEGEVVRDFFEVDYLTARPVAVGPPTLSARAGETGENVEHVEFKAGHVDSGDIAEEEAKKIMDQLRMLGYLED